MTKGIFKILFLFFVSVISILLNSDNSQSCGWDWEGDDYYSIFNEKLISLPSLEPFFLSDYIYHPYEDSSFFDGKKINLSEWRNYFGKEVEIDDIEKVLYPAKEDELIELKYAITTNNNLLVKEKWQNNSLVQFWIKNKNYYSLDYFIYAKEIEPLVEKYYWEIPERDTILMLNLIDEGIESYYQIEDNFLKLRYAFQAIRLSHYTNNYENAIKLYNELVENLNEGSIIKYWALSLKAGALKNLGRTAESNYYFSIVFNDCPERRFISSNSLNVSFNDSLLYASLQLCKNNDEQATLWFLSEFKGYTPALDAINHIYKLNPKSPYMELLLLREVERVEREILPSTEYYWNSYQNYLDVNEYIDKDINKELAKVVGDIAMERKINKPYVWLLAAGYISSLNGDYHKADGFYNSAVHRWPKEDEEKQEKLKVFQILNKCKRYTSYKNLSHVDESQLLPDLVWLKNYDGYGGKDAFLTVRMLMAQKYAAMGNLVKLHMWLGDNRFNYNLTSNPKAEPIDKLISFFENPYKTEYEKFLVSIYNRNVSDLLRIKATILINQHKFEEARKIFSALRTYGNVFADPFVIHIRDCHQCDSKALKNGEMITYNQKSFVEKMIELDSLTYVDPENATKYFFQMANGYYNITFYGNSWYATSYNRDVYNWGYRPDYDWEFYDCSKAKEYYLKAKELSDDDEFKAKCYFMAAKCEQNEFYNDFGGNLLKIDHNDFWNNYYKEKLKYRTNFEILFNYYSDTEFYKDAIKECKYFNTFVKNKAGE